MFGWSIIINCCTLKTINTGSVKGVKILETVEAMGALGKIESIGILEENCILVD